MGPSGGSLEEPLELLWGALGTPGAPLGSLGRPLGPLGGSLGRHLGILSGLWGVPRDSQFMQKLDVACLTL